GLDPSLICGAVLRDVGTNAYAGSGDVLVIEADEYDRAFLALDPEVALVLNVEHDHVDVFPTRADVETAFANFAARVVPGGTLAARRGLPGRSVATYGLAQDATYRVVEVVQSPHGVSFDLSGPFGPPVTIALRLFGVHNARNAAGALAAADACGVPATAAAKAFASFTGTGRRLEELGEAAGVTIIDDYAHHPTEIRASID